MPPYIKELRSRKTPRGMPALGQLSPSPLEVPTDDETDAKSTPFRLPRVESKRDEPDRTLHKVWSRFGYEYHQQKPLDMTEICNKHHLSPRELSQELRRHQLMLPRFSNAVLGPAAPALTTQPKLYAQDFTDPAFLKNFVYAQSHGGGIGRRRLLLEEELMELDPAPTPIPGSHPHMSFTGGVGSLTARSSVIPKSAKSIHWKLSSYRNMDIDQKGKSSKQGPYSRGFTVHCSAPNSWLKMKLGRQKTTVF